MLLLVGLLVVPLFWSRPSRGTLLLFLGFQTLAVSEHLHPSLPLVLLDNSLLNMIQLRFIYLIISVSTILGAHAMTISNRTSTPSASVESSGEDMNSPSTIGPYKPRANMDKHLAPPSYENPKLYPRDGSPTPAPTGPSQTSTTVHVSDASNFAILLPKQGSNSMSPASLKYPPTY